jgi:alkylation response protein AidB-like acyl-CoA dehydrogenase
VSAGLVRHWLAASALDVPLPGSGATAQRWRRLSELAQDDLVAARLVEAHVDAVAILAELSGPKTQYGQLWGVWAAEAPDAVLRACTSGDVVTLTGTKGWCSGAGHCTHALLTARIEDGGRGLFAVALDDDGIRPLPSNWRNPGMQGSDTRSVQFTNALAVPVGRPGDYLGRPGFWHGAIGVAACWLGGAQAVAAPLYQRAGQGTVDEHALAHLGAVDAAITAAEATLAVAAGEVDEDPLDRKSGAEMRARRVRAVVECAVQEAIIRTGRALGPGPLALDGHHARRVADLTMYVRQSHAERDLASLGRLAGAHR